MNRGIGGGALPGVSGALVLTVLEPQQLDLAFEAARITGQGAVAADDAVARHDDRNRVQADRCANRAGGRRAADRHGDLAVAAQHAGFDLEQRAPHLALERRAVQVEPQVEVLQPAGEILRQLPCSVGQQRVFGRDRHLERAGVVLLAREPCADETVGAARQQQRAERRLECHLGRAGGTQCVAGFAHDGDVSRLFHRRSTA